MANRHHVFISHHHADDAQVSRLTGMLARAGHEIRNSSIGVFHGCRIYEVNRAPTFSSTVTVTAGLLLGDIKGWGCGDLQTLKAYHISGVDFGNPLDQLERVGFKVMFGCAPLNNTYYMRIEGYATAIS